MSVLSKWIENTTIEAIASVILNLLFSILDKEGDGIQVYINLQWGKYIVEFEKVETREDKDEDAIFQVFFALKGIIVRASVKTNNEAKA